MMGSPESGGDGIWAGEEPLPETEKDTGFVLGTDQGALSWAVASADTNRLDYLSAQACIARKHIGAWVHVAGTYAGQVMKLFVDGVLAATSYTQTGTIAWPSDSDPAELTLGAWLGSDKQTYFSGMLDEVRIWAVAMTETAINANMYMTLSPPLNLGLGPLALYLRFDRAYCDEINWVLGLVAVNPVEEEMTLVPRVASAAGVELMSVSWACLVECAPVVAPLHGGAYPQAVTHEGDNVSVYCDAGYEKRCPADSGQCVTVTVR